MSDFSDALEAHLLKSGMTEQQLAKLSGFTRSYIALMRSGKRLSPDVEKISKLFAALQLTPHETEILWEAYYKSRYGDGVYQLQDAMVSFVREFGLVRGSLVAPVFGQSLPKVSVIDNAADLNTYIRLLLEQETTRQDGMIRIIAQENFSLLYTLLPMIFRQNPKLKLEQIICMEQVEYKNTVQQMRNLGIIRTLLPVILQDTENQYELYYYYSKLDASFSKTALFPYMILTGHTVVSISSDLSKAIVSEDKDVYGLYERIYEERKSVCMPLLQKSVGDDIYVTVQDDKMSTVINGYSLGQQACTGCLLSADDYRYLVRKYKNSVSPELAQLMEKQFALNVQVSDNMETEHCFFEKRGIRRLMEEGRINDLPSQLDFRFNEKERLKVLKNLIDLTKAGRYETHLLKEDGITCPDGFFFDTLSQVFTRIIYMFDGRKFGLIFNEHGINQIFMDFLNGLRESRYVYSQEETLTYLEKLFAEYFEKFGGGSTAMTKSSSGRRKPVA